MKVIPSLWEKNPPRWTTTRNIRRVRGAWVKVSEKSEAELLQDKVSKFLAQILYEDVLIYWDERARAITTQKALEAQIYWSINDLWLEEKSEALSDLKALSEIDSKEIKDEYLEKIEQTKSRFYDVLWYIRIWAWEIQSISYSLMPRAKRKQRAS